MVRGVDNSNVYYLKVVTKISLNCELDKRNKNASQIVQSVLVIYSR